MTTYILIQATPGVDRVQLVQAVALLPGVNRAESVSGPYDVIAEVREDSSGLAQIILPEITRLSGVLRAISSPIEGPFPLTNQEAAS